MKSIFTIFNYDHVRLLDLHITYEDSQLLVSSLSPFQDDVIKDVKNYISINVDSVETLKVFHVFVVLYQQKLIFNDISIRRFVIRYNVPKHDIQTHQISELWSNLGILLVHLGYNVYQTTLNLDSSTLADQYFQVITCLYPPFEYVASVTNSISQNLSTLNVIVVLLQYTVKNLSLLSPNFLAFIYGLSANFLTLQAGNQLMQNQHIIQCIIQAESLFNSLSWEESVDNFVIYNCFHLPLHLKDKVKIDFFQLLCAPSFMFKTEHFILQSLVSGQTASYKNIKNGILSNSSRSGKSVSLLSTYYYNYFSLRNTTLYVQCAQNTSQQIYSNTSLNYADALKIFFTSEDYQYEKQKYNKIYEKILEEISQKYIQNQEILQRKSPLLSFRQLFFDLKYINFQQFYQKYSLNNKKIFNYASDIVLLHIEADKDITLYDTYVNSQTHNSLLNKVMDNYIFNENVLYPLRRNHTSLYNQLFVEETKKRQEIQLILLTYNNVFFVDYFEEDQIKGLEKYIHAQYLLICPQENWQNELYFYLKDPNMCQQFSILSQQYLESIIKNCENFIQVMTPDHTRSYQQLQNYTKYQSILGITQGAGLTKDQISILIELLKSLLILSPTFIKEQFVIKIQEDFQACCRISLNLNVAICLQRIEKTSETDLIKFQKVKIIALVNNMVAYINEFISARKPSMLREVKDAINNVEAQEILCQEADEAWKDQKLSSLFDLMKVLLNLYPEFATEKLQQDLQVVERQVCKHNEIILDFSRMLSNIDATYLVPIRSLQKETVKVISSVVIYINEFIAARKESLPKEVKDAINNVEAQEILCQNADEAWKDQKLSSLFDLMKVLLNLYPEFATEKLQQDLQVVERQVCKHNEIILDFSRMLSNIDATYLVPIRSLQKETVKVISSVVIYINEFIAARKESLPKEVKDAINNVEAQEILLNVQKNQLFKYSNIFSKLIALFAKYYLIIISFLFVRQKLKVKQQNFQGNKLGNFTYWKDQKLSSLFDLMKVLQKFYPDFIDEKLKTDLQIIFRDIHNKVYNVDVITYLNNIGTFHANDLIKFQTKETIEVISSVVTYINEFIAARKPSMLREVKDAINNVEAQEILCQNADEAWKDQKLSSLFDLMKVLLNLYPEFATEKLQQDLQVVERQVCKHNEIILDFSRMLSNIDATYLVPIRSLQKETVKVINIVVVYINEFIAARKESLPKEVKDAINNVEAQEILCQNADEAWKDQKLSSLFDLMKVLLNLYPEFATEKLQQDLQVVERQVCKHNEIILDFSRMLSNIGATYLVPIRSLQKETVKVISSVVIYINEFIAARKESLPKEVKDAINNVEAQEILLNVQKNQLFKYSNIFSKLIALFAKYYLIIISFLFVRQKLKVKQQNFQGNKLGNFTYWKDQKLSSLFDLMKVLQKFYPDFIDEKLKTDLQIIFRDIHNKVYNVDVITYLNNIGTFHANDLIKFQTKETIEVISSVVTYINEFIAARKPSMLREVKDAINNVEAQEILCQAADEAWKDQKLSSLFDLMKVLLNLYPEFATEKLQQDLQVVERQVCKHNEIILDFSRMLSNIDATYLVPIRSLQKETVKVISSVVIYINEFIAARKESLPKEVKDAINNVEAQEILCQNADEAWKDQKLSSLFDLMKVLLNLYPEFATEKLQQDLQVVERQVCKHNEIILDFSRMLSNIDATYLVPIRSLQKETVKVINIVVVYINEFIAARKGTLPKEGTDAINSIEAQEILCQEADEAWKDQKLSTLCQLLLQMNRVSDQFATYASNLVQHLPQKYKQQDNSPQKVQINDNLLLLVDEVLVQQNRRRSYNQDLVFEKYTQCAKLYKPIEYLTLIMMNSPIIDNPRGLDQVQKYYNTITQGSSNSNGLLVFIQELYNLRAIESTFWRSINYYIERVQSHIKSYNIKTQCIYAGTDMSIFNFIKRNNIQQNIESSSDVRSYQHSRIIGIPQPHVSLLKQIFKSQQVTIALDNDKGLINKVQVMAAVTFLDYYNIQCPEKALEKQLYLPFISPQLWLCMKNQKIAFNNLKQVNVNNQTLFSVNKSNCFGQYFDIVKLDKNIQYNINFVQYDEFKILTTSSGYINLNYLVLFYYKIQINFSKFIKNISSDDINQLLVMQNLPYLTEINSLLLFLYTIVGNHETISDLSKIFKAQNLYSIYFNIVGSDLPQAASLELMKSICKNADFVCLQQPFDDFIYDDITFSEFQQSILKYGLNYSNLVFQSLKTTASCKTLICAISIDKQELFRKFQTIDQKHPDFLITFHGFTGLEGIMDQQDGVYYMMFDSGSHSEIGLTLKAKNFSKSIAQVGVIQSDIILFQSDVVTPKSMLRIYESEVRKSAKKRQK